MSLRALLILELPDSKSKFELSNFWMKFQIMSSLSDSRLLETSFDIPNLFSISFLLSLSLGGIDFDLFVNGALCEIFALKVSSFEVFCESSPDTFNLESNLKVLYKAESSAWRFLLLVFRLIFNYILRYTQCLKLLLARNESNWEREIPLFEVNN